MFINIILELLFVAVRYRDVVFSKNNPSFFYDFYFLFLHNERPVNPDKPVSRQFVFHHFILTSESMGRGLSSRCILM